MEERMGWKPWAEGLLELFERERNAANAASMKAYMRGQFDYYGIKTPLRHQLQREWAERHGRPADDIEAVVRWLWGRPERECQYAALDLLSRFNGKAPQSRLDLLEELVTAKSWWDTVDSLAGGLLGPLLLRFPEEKQQRPERWLHSDNLWLRRTAILYQLKYKERTDEQRLFAYALHFAESQEFFLRKAIGWSLREYGKTNPDAVRLFVERNQHRMSSLSVREALKHLGV